MPSTRRSKKKSQEEKTVVPNINLDQAIAPLPSGTNGGKNAAKPMEISTGEQATRMSGSMGPKSSGNKMFPVHPTPATYTSSSPVSDSIVVPAFHDLINYEYCLQRIGKEGTRNCVMCGLARPVVTTKKKRTNEEPYMLAHNAGVCSVCQDLMWNMAGNSKVELRFCFVCNSFKCWEDFRKSPDSDKMVKSCKSCRGNQKKEHQPRKKKQKVEKKRDDSAGCVVVSLQPAMPLPSTAEKDITLPNFASIANYPNYLHHKFGKKTCVLCGLVLDYFPSKKGHKDAGHCIFARNCGICNVCDTKVWKLKSNNALIKWCGGCNHFRPFTAFRGEKNNVMKRCCHCQVTVHAYTKKKLSSTAEKGKDAKVT